MGNPQTYKIQTQTHSHSKTAYSGKAIYTKQKKIT